jgi:hypothetical protein
VSPAKKKERRSEVSPASEALRQVTLGERLREEQRVPWLRRWRAKHAPLGPLIGSAPAIRHTDTMATTTRHKGLDGCSTRRTL